MRLSLIVLAVAVGLVGCSSSETNKPKSNQPPRGAQTPSPTPVPVYGYQIVNTYPHDGNAFTQGLIYHEGFLYESTGGEERGRSTLRRVELETGKVVQKFELPAGEFGEGIAMIGDKIYMITWRDRIGRVFDAKTFRVEKEFDYMGEGWGLATDGSALYMTQGTHVIKVLDAQTLKQTQTIPVMRENGKPLVQMNELEWIKDELWANIWHSEQPDILGKPNYIARIDPGSGKLLGWIDLAGISPVDQNGPNQEENTLNGIAYDATKDRIFVTGKNWKHLFEIKLTAPKNY